MKRPVDDEEDEVVVILDLRPLVELLGVLDSEWVEPEGLAQDLEVSRLRLVEVEPEETPAREQLRDLLAAEVHLGAAAIVDDVAGPRRALRERRLDLELLAHERRLAGLRRRILGHDPIVLTFPRAPPLDLRVLAGDDNHPEHSDGELRDVHAGQGNVDRLMLSQLSLFRSAAVAGVARS